MAIGYKNTRVTLFVNAVHINYKGTLLLASRVKPVFLRERAMVFEGLGYTLVEVVFAGRGWGGSEAPGRDGRGWPESRTGVSYSANKKSQLISTGKRYKSIIFG